MRAAGSKRILTEQRYLHACSGCVLFVYLHGEVKEWILE